MTNSELSEATAGGLISAEEAPSHHSRHGHVVHRLAHALYGLIILTATVGELATHDEDMETAILIVGVGAIVLVFAHSYSQFVASTSQLAGFPPARVMWSNAVDQLALAIPATLAVGVFALAAGDLIADNVAYNIVLVGTLVTLFGLGLIIGAHHRRTWVWSVGVGIANTIVGLVIIGIEAGAAH
ncbi:MAG: hypothetical protein QNM02_16435 [Acidimicrobiia bacterium]|nr:hypothetical protein [Acidimicrobiia bacterium]